MDRPGPNFSTMGSVEGKPTYSSSPSNDLSSSPSDLSRFPGHQPHHNPSHSRSISSSSVNSSIASRKSRYAEPGTTEVHAKRTSVSIPPQSPSPLKSPRSLLPHARRESGTSDSWSEDPTAAEDSDTPRLRPTVSNETSFCSSLPEPAWHTKRSSFDIDNRRLSGTSVYSYSSSRGFISPSVSAQGSDLGGPPRSVPGFSPSGKSPATGQSEAGITNVTVTTTSNGQSGQISSGHHHLTPRDSHSQPLDLIQRNRRTETMSTNSTNIRPQPDRSRSRAKRRFSGSTATSSHSPSSDRAPHHRDREEGE